MRTVGQVSDVLAGAAIVIIIFKEALTSWPIERFYAGVKAAWPTSSKLCSVARISPIMRRRNGLLGCLGHWMPSEIGLNTRSSGRFFHSVTAPQAARATALRAALYRVSGLVDELQEPLLAAGRGRQAKLC